MFPTQGLEPGPPHCKQILYQLNHQRNSHVKRRKAENIIRERGSWRNFIPEGCIGLGLSLVMSAGLMCAHACSHVHMCGAWSVRSHTSSHWSPRLGKHLPITVAFSESPPCPQPMLPPGSRWPCCPLFSQDQLMCLREMRAHWVSLPPTPEKSAFCSSHVMIRTPS